MDTAKVLRDIRVWSVWELRVLMLWWSWWHEKEVVLSPYCRCGHGFTSNEWSRTNLSMNEWVDIVYIRRFATSHNQWLIFSELDRFHGITCVWLKSITPSQGPFRFVVTMTTMFVYPSGHVTFVFYKVSTIATLFRNEVLCMWEIFSRL